MGLISLSTTAQTTYYVSATGTNVNPASATSWATSTTNLQGAINMASTNGGGTVYVASGLYKPGGKNNTDRSISFSMANNVTILGGYAGSGTPGISTPRSSTLSGDIGTPSSTSDNSYHVISNPSGLTTTAVLDGFIITGGNANLEQPGYFGGGGVFNDGKYGNFCSPTFRNCTIQDNYAIYFGGGMYNDGGFGLSSPVLINCAIQSNTAIHGGALYNGADNGISSPVLTNCSILNNIAFRYGGAMNNDGYMGEASIVLTNCLLQGNHAGERGGALYNKGDHGKANPVLINCALQGNIADEIGGGLFNSGDTGKASPVLINCSMQGNLAPQGGAMLNFGFIGKSAPVLLNSVFWNNNSSGTPGEDGIMNVESPGPSASYCLFDNATSVLVTNPGNLTTVTSPFASLTSVTLSACSPAINAGNSVSYTAATSLTTDVTGNPRTVGNSIDMGAIEFQGTPVHPIALTLSPASGSVVCAGSNVSVPVSITGEGAVTYQWYKTSFASPVVSQTTATLSLPQAQTTDAGSYSVVVTGGV